MFRRRSFNINLGMENRNPYPEPALWYEGRKRHPTPMDQEGFSCSRSVTTGRVVVRASLLRLQRELWQPCAVAPCHQPCLGGLVSVRFAVDTGRLAGEAVADRTGESGPARGVSPAAGAVFSLGWTALRVAIGVWQSAGRGSSVLRRIVPALLAKTFTSISSSIGR